MSQSRRQFLKNIVTVGAALAMNGGSPAQAYPVTKHTENPSVSLFRAINGKPDENLIKVVELMGGIDKIIGFDDLVMIKPNVQWWNQGAPNLGALVAFVDLIMNRRGGFKGEVVVAENCHRGAQPWTTAGWANRFEVNADLLGINHFNALSEHLKTKYAERFSTCHWIDVTRGAKRVYGPAEGNGYVYCDGTGGVPRLSLDNGAEGDYFRATIMTYPVFTTDAGTVVDYKHGVWKDGAYTRQPLRFVNFAALNHHSTYCGATSAVKNYLGVADLSGGPDPKTGGKLTDDYYNFHSFPFDKWADGPRPGMLGAEVGYFMKTIRRPDLNITTAEWVGLASRTDPPIARTRAILASTDPVALDYHAFKYVLYPNSRIKVHNPDAVDSPVHQDLSNCAEQGGGVFDEKYVKVESYDFAKRNVQSDDELVVHAAKQWGTNPKAILRYFYLKYGLARLIG